MCPTFDLGTAAVWARFSTPASNSELLPNVPKHQKFWDRSVVRAQAGSGSGTTVGSTPGFCPGRFSASFGFWPSPGLGPGRGRAEFATPSPSRLPSGNPSSPVGLYSQPTCDAIHHTIPRAHSFRDPIVHPAFMSMLQTALT